MGGKRYMNLDRQSFLSVYLVLKDKNWDALYLYQKLIDIFGDQAMKHWEFLFEKQILEMNDSSELELEIEKDVLPTFNLVRLEKMAIIGALNKCNWQQNEAAELVGISPRAMNYRISLLEIKYPKWRKNKGDAGCLILDT